MTSIHLHPCMKMVIFHSKLQATKQQMVMFLLPLLCFQSRPIACFDPSSWVSKTWGFGHHVHRGLNGKLVAKYGQTHYQWRFRSLGKSLNSGFSSRKPWSWWHPTGTCQTVSDRGNAKAMQRRCVAAFLRKNPCCNRKCFIAFSSKARSGLLLKWLLKKGT